MKLLPSHHYSPTRLVFLFTQEPDFTAVLHHVVALIGFNPSQGSHKNRLIPSSRSELSRNQIVIRNYQRDPLGSKCINDSNDRRSLPFLLQALTEIPAFHPLKRRHNSQQDKSPNKTPDIPSFPDSPNDPTSSRSSDPLSS